MNGSVAHYGELLDVLRILAVGALLAGSGFWALVGARWRIRRKSDQTWHHAFGLVAEDRDRWMRAYLEATGQEGTPW